MEFNSSAGLAAGLRKSGTKGQQENLMSTVGHRGPDFCRAARKTGNAGLTLIETLIVVSILAVMLSIAVPSYRDHLERGDILSAEEDILFIADEIMDYLLDRGHYPDSLDELNLVSSEDPWGNPYEYLRIDHTGTGAGEGPGKGPGKGGVGKLRKDKNLVPINSDFDLYSKGPDGRSVSPLTAKHSRDDIIRANNGSFIGIAEDY